MKKLLIACLVLLSLVACQKRDTGKVLATIDGESITLEEFNRELDRIPTNMKMLVVSQEGKKTFLERLIMKKLLLKEATKEKIEGEKEFQEKLSDIKDQLLIESLLKKKINASVQPSDEDVKKYYEANKEQFKKSTEINTRHILLKTEGEAKQVQSRLQKGEDFAQLAREFSIDPNAKTTGGEIGFHPKGALVKEYDEAAFKLKKVGQISPIVKTQFGYHIIRLESMKQPTYVPLDEVKDAIRQNLVQARQGEMVEKYIEDLKKNAKITKNEDLLKGEEKAKDTEKKDAKAEPPVTKTDEQPAKKDEAPAKKAEPPAKKDEAPAKKDETPAKKTDEQPAKKDAPEAPKKK